ncbi:MAG: hypothetical protein FJW29_09305, partial [Acidobacteria bacterium]|nr:hypothetical protein [Acidobacteriota bacterium]
MTWSLLMRVPGIIAVVVTVLIWHPTGAGAWADLVLGVTMALALLWAKRRVHTLHSLVWRVLSSA